MKHLFLQPIKLFCLLIVALMAACSHPNRDSVGALFQKKTVKVTFTQFFDEKSDRDVENLQLDLELEPSKTLVKPLPKSGCSIKYSHEEAQKTAESLENYLNTLKDSKRYEIDFSVDSLKIKVFATSKLDILYVIVLNKYNNRFHFIEESFFVLGTILKTTQRDIKSRNGDFNDVTIEKVTTSLYHENRLFSMRESLENASGHDVNFSDKDACNQIESAFLMRQFCKDALLKLKDQYPDWFQTETH